MLFGIAIFCVAGVIQAADKSTTKAKVRTTGEIYNCLADTSWFTSPSMPTEVDKSADNGTSSDFCDFYRFSWQAFAYLMTPTSTNSDVRNFDDASQFPELQVNADGTPANSCSGESTSNTFFIRTAKSASSGAEFTIPERIGQAGGGATIYDQSGNVVYYDVRFSKNLCDVSAIQKLNNFPGGTTELKTAWKVLGDNDDATKFITIDAQIGDQPQPTKLGMIGFHIAAATPDHPEFVWATFEHSINVPDCENPSATSGWSFTSQACATALQNNDALGVVQCRFNNPSPQTDPSKVSGQTPTEICREFPYGSAEGDLKYAENVGDIKSLNNNVQPNLVGDYAVLKNYFNVGAIWVSDTTQSSDVPNQRGSLRLANSVAETDYQNVDLNPETNNGFASNCMGCHNYVGTSLPASGKNTTSGSLSHIFDDIAVGAKQCLDVQTSQTVNGQSQAANTCPTTCSNSSSNLQWNGQWTNQDAQTGQQLPMTVCGCCGKG